MERNVSVPRVIEKHESSVEQQQHRSDSNNKSIQQQLPPIFHDKKLPVVKKLDGRAGKAEKWQIACENGFGRMIPATFNYFISIMARNDLIFMICQILNSYVQRSCARVY